MTFWNILFDDDDFTCLGKTPKDTNVYSIIGIDEVPNLPSFFSINALDGFKDNNPTESWHSASVPRRADHNVTKFRSFLIEMDKGTLEEQKKAIDYVHMPYSTCVFSGSKSLHFIISLETPLKNKVEYDSIARHLHKVLANTTNLVDASSKNASRFSRTPYAWREDTGRNQSLVEIKSRVPTDIFMAWLCARGPAIEAENSSDNLRSLKYSGQLSKYTKHFLAFGAEPGSWNVELFKAAADMTRNGFEKHEVLDKLSDITGFLDTKDRKTIESAWKAARSEK